ncbi:Gfo/Idh/MocA family oxidoreductase [Terrarubrum flagellatum]|uniref:Gfo/Idh/MocA family protein n=1 Tax=Terrirubrum flagellatum TaxID=2895980 RepID=UPI003144E659
MSVHHEQRRVAYNFEYEKRLKACFIGAGGHSYRNVYPTMRYAPVDLVAVCDVDGARAREYARIFGAEGSYSDHRAMLANEKPDIVFIVTGYHPDGRVQATDIALDALASGVHVWMEKPTAASLAEVKQLEAASIRYNRQCMTGLKKMFFPAIEKLKDIIASDAFGRLSSLYVRYPQALPREADRADLPKMQSFLDHIYHPVSILHFIAGPVARASYEWEPVNGACVASLKFQSGAIGTLHFAAGQSGSSPLERVEAIGEKANAVVDNGVHLRYYRRAELPAYGRAASFIQNDDAAPIFWEPECSLGQLYNNNMFYLGYAPEVLHFCEAVLNGKSIAKGTLETAAEVMRLYDFFATTPAGVVKSLAAE